MILAAATQVCSRTGCARPPLYRPVCTFVDGSGRTVVHQISVCVCTEHRDHLTAIFRRPQVLAAVRRCVKGRRPAAAAELRLTFLAIH